LGQTVDQLEKAQTEGIFIREFGKDSIDFEILLQEISDGFVEEESLQYPVQNIGITVESLSEDSTSIHEIIVRSEVDEEDLQWVDQNAQGEDIFIQQVISPDTSYIDTLIRQDQVNHKIHVLGRVMKQILVDESSKEDPLAAKIQGVNIDSMLLQNLKSKGIETSFQTAVYDASKDSILADYSPAWKGDESDVYSSSLFPQNPRLNNFELLADMPERGSFALQAIAWNLAASVGFIFIILLTFAFTIYYILRQKRASQVKTDFINNMTHEFKTPLATIALAADSIKHPEIINKPQEIEHFAELIRKQGSKLDEHIERVLQLARMEQGEIPLNIGKINLNELAEKASKGMLLHAQTKQGSIRLILDKNPIEVMGDEYQLYNAILNLLDNAVKYCLKEPAITVETRLDGPNAMVRITDNGIGISRRQQKRMFDTFYRAESGDLHNVKGFGLGLSYVWKIVQLHKGEIKVNSHPNKGTVISILIPTAL